jgi:hypothetical protein
MKKCVSLYTHHLHPARCIGGLLGHIHSPMIFLFLIFKSKPIPTNKPNNYKAFLYEIEKVSHVT